MLALPQLSQTPYIPYLTCHKVKTISSTPIIPTRPLLGCIDSGASVSTVTTTTTATTTNIDPTEYEPICQLEESNLEPSNNLFYYNKVYHLRQRYRFMSEISNFLLRQLVQKSPKKRNQVKSLPIQEYCTIISPTTLYNNVDGQGKETRNELRWKILNEFYDPLVEKFYNQIRYGMMTCQIELNVQTKVLGIVCKKMVSIENKDRDGIDFSDGEDVEVLYENGNQVERWVDLEDSSTDDDSDDESEVDDGGEDDGDNNGHTDDEETETLPEKVYDGGSRNSQEKNVDIDNEETETKAEKMYDVVSINSQDEDVDTDDEVDEDDESEAVTFGDDSDDEDYILVERDRPQQQNLFAQSRSVKKIDLWEKQVKSSNGQQVPSQNNDKQVQGRQPTTITGTGNGGNGDIGRYGIESVKKSTTTTTTITATKCDQSKRHATSLIGPQSKKRRLLVQNQAVDKNEKNQKKNLSQVNNADSQILEPSALSLPLTQSNSQSRCQSQQIQQSQQYRGLQNQPPHRLQNQQNHGHSQRHLEQSQQRDHPYGQQPGHSQSHRSHHQNHQPPHDPNHHHHQHQQHRYYEGEKENQSEVVHVREKKMSFQLNRFLAQQPATNPPGPWFYPHPLYQQQQQNSPQHQSSTAIALPPTRIARVNNLSQPFVSGNDNHLPSNSFQPQ